MRPRACLRAIASLTSSAARIGSLSTIISSAMPPVPK
jgi:hypothetical protein